MENEVFPTNFIQKKNEIVGSNKIYEKPFTNMKTYHGEEIQPYMKDKISETITVPNENIAKYYFNLPTHRSLYNDNVSSLILFLADQIPFRFS